MLATEMGAGLFLSPQRGQNGQNGAIIKVSALAMTNSPFHVARD